MARVTIGKIDGYSEFSVVVAASRRARAILSGSAPLVPFSPDDKPTVIALREIESGKISVEDMMKLCVKDLRRTVEEEFDFEEDN